METKEKSYKVTHVREPELLTSADKKAIMLAGLGFILIGGAGVSATLTGYSDITLGILGGLCMSAGGVLEYTVYKNNVNEKEKRKVR